jgi:prevent-host-death family protein
MIPNKNNISTVTDMRRDAIGLLKDVQKKGMKYIFQNSNPKGVILSMEEYGMWMERLEDLQDQIRVYQLENEPRTGWTSLEDVAKEYGVKL